MVKKIYKIKYFKVIVIIIIAWLVAGGFTLRWYYQSNLIAPSLNLDDQYNSGVAAFPSWLIILEFFVGVALIVFFVLKGINKTNGNEKPGITNKREDDDNPSTDD